MINRHLTDNELQLYVMDKNQVDPELAEHILACDECREKVAAYELLFTAISEEKAPAFDFDLAEAVMAKLPVQKKRTIKVGVPFLLFLLSAVLITGGVLYVFREDFDYIFTGVTTLAVYLIAITGVILLAALGIDMFTTYQNKIDSLDYH